MLALVAGPFDVVPHAPLDTSARLGQVAIWLEPFGLVALSVSTVYLVQPDGRAVRLGGPVNTTGLGYSVVTREPILSLSSGVWYCVELPGGRPVSETWGYGNSTMGVLADRKIMVGSGHVKATAYGAAWPGTTEYSLPGGDILAYAGEENGHSLWWAIARADGKAYLYDSTSQTEITSARTGMGSALLAAGYSVKHRLFFVVRDEGTVDRLYVYSREPVASSLSTPTLGEAVAKGRAVAISSTLTGSYGEACPGRVVSFSSTVGDVAPAAVVTNASGVASSVLYAPLETAVGATLTATLVE